MTLLGSLIDFLNNTSIFYMKKMEQLLKTYVLCIIELEV